MADRLQAIELKNSSNYGRYSNEDEDAGLLASSGRNDSVQRAAQQAAAHQQDEEGIVPIMIEDFLEKNGVMDKIRPYINNDGQIKHTFSRQLVAEFLGTMLFQIFGGAAPAEGGLAAPANGFALVAIIYGFANVSGANLNPAVSFALMCTGHMTWWKTLAYMCMQVLGSIFGSLIYAALIPGLHIAHKEFGDGNAPGCFGPSAGVTKSNIFGWELLMTMLLVLVVYASAVTKPGHGNTAPIAIGLSLYAAALTGGPYTGASLNPARTIGPACVFACNVGISFLYIFSEFCGALCAAGIAIFMYGRAPIERGGN